MAWGDLALYGALALGALYGIAFCYGTKGLAGFLVKTGSTALLALYAWFEGGPILLVAALALSALGDGFLATDEEQKWLLPGMAAFFLAHACYVVLFWNEGVHTGWDWPVKLAQAVLVFGGAAFVHWLAPSIEPKMRLPVILYAGVILMMGAAAFTMPLLVLVGALMFIASDAILSLQLFRKPAGEPASVLSSLAVWFLYFGGQALIAWGVLNGNVELAVVPAS